MKTIFIHIVLGVLFFASTNAFAQDRYTDEEIRFDSERLIRKLTKRGFQVKAIEGIIKEERDNAIIVHERLIKIEKEYDLNNNLRSINNSKNACSINNLPQSEKDALEALYNATNGSGWSNNNGWLNYDICDWYGVTIQNKHVVSLSLGGNNLVGEIPSLLGNLTQIEHVNLGSNNLIGSIPASLGSLINVKYFRLSNNGLTGNIPSSLGNLSMVNYFNLTTNNLTGSIPSSLGNFQQVEYFDIGVNDLTGPIPSSLGNLISVITFNVDLNNLTGQIPNELGGLTNAKTMNFSHNKLSNNIPASLSNLVNVELLSFWDNELTGSIPSEFGSLSNVQLLWFSINNLTGEVPQELTTLNVNTLSSLQFYINNLSGDLPDFSLFNLITHFRFYDNKFRFKNFEDNYNVFYNNIVDYDFAPQDLIDNEISVNVVEEQSYTFIMFTDNYYSNNNTYQWYKGIYPNGIAIPGAISRTYTKTNLSLSDTGDYYCLAGNTVVNGLYDYNGQYYSNYRLQRRPIHLVVEDGDPCDTVAIIVDESGSLSEEEKQDIRRGLSRFIEDQLDSGLNISITGMSDSDIDVRNDHIPKQKVTTATKPQFDQWIASYGNRNGETGISGSSDYWASALNVVKNSDHTPKLVVILTDGSQTADIGYLQEQINWVRQNSNLYVYGIDNEYYVNSDNVNARLSRSQDPNYSTIDRKQTRSFNNSTSRGVVSSIRTSLDYLFGNTDEDEPISGQENLLAADYYGYDDFSGISDAYGTELGILSNLFAQSEISCTATIDECYACYSFQPEPGKWYWLSGWVKADLNTQIKSYTDLNFIDAGGNPIIAAPSIELTYWDAADIEIPSINPYPSIFYPSGNIIDGWQRIAGKFKIPENTVTLDIELYNSSPNIPVYFDDIRVHPIKGSMKSFVYDPVTYRLMAELDENNYSTYYEYDNEGGLVRVKKETSRGIKTIQETRSGTVINNSNSNTNNDEN